MLDRQHLLIIDSHKSHVYNVAFFDCMKANNVHVMAIPPHMSHIVQALDSTLFAKFKKLWQWYLTEWNNNTKVKLLPKSSFWDVFYPAWTHSMMVVNIQSGFRKTGVYPLNFDAIDKSKFTPSIITDSKNICSLSWLWFLKFQMRIVCFIVLHTWFSFAVMFQNLNFFLCGDTQFISSFNILEAA